MTPNSIPLKDHDQEPKVFPAPTFEDKGESVLGRLRHASFPERKSEVLTLLDKVIDNRSERQINMVFDELLNAGMMEDLREISRSLTLRAIILTLTEFDRTHGRLPEMSKDATHEEFILAAWAHFYMKGPDPFARGALNKSPRWIEAALKNP